MTRRYRVARHSRVTAGPVRDWCWTFFTPEDAEDAGDAREDEHAVVDGRGGEQLPDAGEGDAGTERGDAAPAQEGGEGALPAFAAVRAALELSVESGDMRYWCFQVERCPESGRLHLQGFVRFVRPHRRRAVQRRCGIGESHTNPRHAQSTPEQARDYCRKEESRVDGPWEGGEWVTQGQRTDLDAVRRSIERGDSERVIAQEHFGDWVRYYGAFARYRNLLAVRRTDACDVRVYVGNTGCGKSRAAWDEFPELYPAPLPGERSRSSPWFDNYCAHDVVLIDDFTGNEYEIGFMLKLLDRYPMQVPVKGSFVNWAPKIIIITSNVHPDLWFPMDTVEHKAALRRRITSIRLFPDV